MSFGLHDKDWVDPPEPEPIQCQDCTYWFRCPCGCDYGWCTKLEDFTEYDDECD